MNIFNMALREEDCILDQIYAKQLFSDFYNKDFIFKSD